MNNFCSLTEKHCVPCQGGTPPLSIGERQLLLEHLNHEWVLNEPGHLYKQFKFKNFRQAMDFANKIASLAEVEGHHPDLYIAWGVCQVEIWTHKINGLTESDFILAAKIENLL